ncbi:hypothetical protein GQ600_21934 [Phytophthora cactorum]|nr:hypothetical protein GQ600_21934 [Phytophthora cactorum]
MDGHINVTADIGDNCSNVEQSLRRFMLTVLDRGAINEDTPHQQIVGLISIFCRANHCDTGRNDYQSLSLRPGRTQAERTIARFWVGFTMQPPACGLLVLSFSCACKSIISVAGSKSRFRKT